MVLLAALMVIAGFEQMAKSQAAWLFSLTFILAAMSWVDDLRGLGPLFRFGAHVVSVGLALSFGLLDGPVFGAMLSPVLDKIAAGLLWVWFINLFNFMDGIDGIAGVEALSIGGGITLLAVFSGVGSDVGNVALVVAAGAGGFLVWNWHPAKIFLGDVGSVPLGFVLGWLLLSLSAAGYWLAALILPLYFLVDAGLTLLRRLLRGEKIWQAHRQHFYQYAAQHGRSHGEVATAVALCNSVLIVLAFVTPNGRISWTIIAALGVVTFLIFWMVRTPQNQSSGGPV